MNTIKVVLGNNQGYSQSIESTGKFSPDYREVNEKGVLIAELHISDKIDPMKTIILLKLYQGRIYRLTQSAGGVSISSM